MKILRMAPLVAAVFFLACSSIPTSRVKNCEGPFVNQRKMNGVYKCTFSDGKPSGEFLYKNGKQNGVSKVFSHDGYLQYTITYKDNLFDGPTKEFDSEGHLLSVRLYKNGLLDGESVEYWPSGKVKEQIIYREGNETGIQKNFDETGAPVPSPHEAP